MTGRTKRPYKGGVPAPPEDIKAEMEAAGAARDDVRLGLARARYDAWLIEHGYPVHPQGRPPRADRAAQ